jgi:hypothetical protein
MHKAARTVVPARIDDVFGPGQLTCSHMAFFFRTETTAAVWIKTAASGSIPLNSASSEPGVSTSPKTSSIPSGMGT